MHFWKNACRGYMMIVEPFNGYWSYLFSCEWRHSTEDTLSVLFLLASFILATPVAYLLVAPIMAFIEGTKEEEDTCL